MEGIELTLSQRYNASNNELLRTQTLVKSCVVDIDATPFRQWYEAHVSFSLSACLVNHAHFSLSMPNRSSVAPR